MKVLICILSLLLSLVGLSVHAQEGEVVQYSYVVKESLPHATDSYTQGLEFYDGVLYEGTGLYGTSRLMRGDVKSGEMEVMAHLPRVHFGEGITIIGDTIYMLTWRENTLYLFDRVSGEQIGTKRYFGEGWGLCSDGVVIYMSDGSNSITVRDPANFTALSIHPIIVDGRPVTHLNELEWIDGKIWANIYYRDEIVIIDPKSWRVEGVIDMRGLLPDKLRTRDTDVLNGIAYDKSSGKVYVTGKNWARIFEIEIVEK